MLTDSNMVCDHGCPVIEDCEACEIELYEHIESVSLIAAEAAGRLAMGQIAERTRMDVLLDMSNRLWLGLPLVDFDTGEPCDCAHCYARGTLDPDTAKFRHVPLKVITPQGRILRAKHGPIPGP